MDQADVIAINCNTRKSPIVRKKHHPTRGVSLHRKVERPRLYFWNYGDIPGWPSYLYEQADHPADCVLHFSVVAGSPPPHLVSRQSFVLQYWNVIRTEQRL